MAMWESSQWLGKSFVQSTGEPFTTQSALLTTLSKNPFQNIAGKGENAGDQHFLFFRNCFQPYPSNHSSLSKYTIIILANFILSSANAFNLDQSRILLFGKELTPYSINTQSHFNASTTDSFENIVGKEEIARDEQFLLFPQCFLLNQKIVSPFVHIFGIISLFAAEFEEPKIGI